jgi:hypothetical protein
LLTQRRQAVKLLEGLGKRRAIVVREVYRQSVGKAPAECQYSAGSC